MIAKQKRVHINYMELKITQVLKGSSKKQFI